MLLAALPVIALGAALIALGLIWKEHGDQVRAIVGQIGVIVSHVFSMIVEWVRNAIEAILSIEGPFGDMLRGLLGDGQRTIGVLDDVIARMRETNRVRAEEVAAQSAQTTQTFNAEEAWAGVMEMFGQANQSNQSNMTIYGGVQQYGDAIGASSLEELWAQGLT